jgi:hypothetical protein
MLVQLAMPAALQRAQLFKVRCSFLYYRLKASFADSLRRGKSSPQFWDFDAAYAGWNVVVAPITIGQPLYFGAAWAAIGAK